MRFEYSYVGNLDNAIRGLRHPYESYKKSDSGHQCKENPEEICKGNCFKANLEKFIIGKNDLDLCQRMIKAGSPNDKFLRQIFVSVDITAPLYWWKELDTYKVATTTNSTSTMHKIATTPITKDCFETGDYQMDFAFVDELISFCEGLRLKYLETKDLDYWKELIRWLPESWLQTRTWTGNYAVLRNILRWRKNHKLKYEWDSFIRWCQFLPYSQELLFYENGYNNYEIHELLTSKK